MIEVADRSRSVIPGLSRTEPSRRRTGCRMNRDPTRRPPGATDISPPPASRPPLKALPDPQPTAPARQIVLKLHARCDLRCDYCYVYTKADQRWRTAVRVISRPTIGQAAVRIGEHAHDHRLPSVDLILHGGEPLLAGPDLIGYTVRSVRAQVGRATGGATRVEAMMQTN